MTGNFILALAKGIAGVLGNSYALIADAIESTTDVFSSFLLLIGIRYSVKPPDDNHPYGHGRAEPLLTFVVVGFLVISATIIAYESISRIMTPHKVPATFTLWVLGIVILLKELLYRHVSKKGKKANSRAVIADAWHHRGDALTSFLAFGGISFAILMGEGYESADDWAALAASLIIVFNAYHLFRPALGEIMDEHIYDDLVLKIRFTSEKVKGVMGTEKCFVRKSGFKYLVDLHMIVDGEISVESGHQIAHELKDRIRKEIPEIQDVLIHMEPFNPELKDQK